MCAHAVERSRRVVLDSTDSASCAHGGGTARHGRSGRVRVCTAAPRGAHAVACGRGRLCCAAAAAGCRRRGGGVRTVVARHGMDAVGVCACARWRCAAHTRWHAGVAGCAVQRCGGSAARRRRVAISAEVVRQPIQFALHQHNTAKRAQIGSDCGRKWLTRRHGADDASRRHDRDHRHQHDMTEI